MYQLLCISLIAFLPLKEIHFYKEYKNFYEEESVESTQLRLTAPTDFFESNADGNWAAPASWKSSSVSSSGPWTIPATSAPSNNAQGIVIKNKITIATNESASLLVIAAGGTLVHNYSKVLTLSDDGSASPDMLLQNGGVYEIYGT
ncbi:MAG: hypothetical protein ABI653_05445, partial [Bacteroidota bacterium]